MSADSTTFTATGATATLDKNALETVSTLAIAGTYTTVSFTVEGTLDGTNWQEVLVISNKDGTTVSGGSTISPANSAELSWNIPNAVNFVGYRLNVAGIASGTVTVQLFSQQPVSPVPFINVASAGGSFTSLSVAGTTTITSASATALTVGRLGATTPALTVDASAGTSVTGFKVASGAVTGGAALTVTSSGTNEPGTIDSKGAGVLSLNTTATGTVYMTRGGLTGPVIGKTLTAVGTSQSSTPTTAQLLGGLISQTGSTGAGAVTLPTGTAISAAMPLTPVVGDTFTCRFMNLGGGQTLTITGATGSTVVGTATVGTGTNIDLVFYNSGSNTWNVYTNK